MLRLRLLWIGKTRSAPLAAMSEEYLRRMRPLGAVAGVELDPRRAAATLLRQAAQGPLWLLDPAGRPFTSGAFAQWIAREAARSGKELALAVGAADGFPAEVAAAASGKISLSPFTFSHDLARVMALEQVYRALTLLAGHPYAK